MARRSLLVPLLASVITAHAPAEPIDAATAKAALQRGAIVWDVRDGADRVIPGAVRVDAAALQRWLHGGSLDTFAGALSAAGVDLARDVIVYGDAGDSRALAIDRALVGIATGRVLWLVGGLPEWRLAGLPTVPDASVRLPVPQKLVARDGAGSAAAAAALRGSFDAEPPRRVAAQPPF
jgi:3-mercaptopyruvate sulfurtransferase SseA